jgi:hypothetical protein
MTTFKIGQKVYTTVKMTTEDVGEDIEVGTLATVLSEPSDDEELVMVAIGNSIHYLPQDVLSEVELIGDNNSFHRHDGNRNEERS